MGHVLSPIFIVYLGVPVVGLFHRGLFQPVKVKCLPIAYLLLFDNVLSPEEFPLKQP